jgi:hypothetical protein
MKARHAWGTGQASLLTENQTPLSAVDFRTIVLAKQTIHPIRDRSGPENAGQVPAILIIMEPETASCADRNKPVFPILSRPDFDVQRSFFLR